MRVRPLVLSWLALLLLLGATVVASLLPIGAWRQVLNLAIAAGKAAIILWIFMKLRSEPGLVRLAFGVSGVLLIVFGSLLIADYQLRPKGDRSLAVQIATPR